MVRVDLLKRCQTSLYRHQPISQIPAFHKVVVSRQIATDSRHKVNGVHQMHLVTEIKAEMVVVETADLVVDETEVDMVAAEMVVLVMAVAETGEDMAVDEMVVARAVEKVVDTEAVMVAAAVALETETVAVMVVGMEALAAVMEAETADLVGETVDHVSVV